MKLADYKNNQVGKENVALTTDEELQAELNAMLQQAKSSKEKEGKSQLGDIVTIDFEGFVDGVAFEGGKGENYDLELGSNSFIPGFEDQLVGYEKDADVDVKVTFPTNYHAENLAGKESVFKCKIHAVKEKVTPELNDEFSMMYGIPTIEELKSILRMQMDNKKKEQSINEYIVKLCDAIIANSELDLDEEKVNARMKEMLEYYSNAMKQYGTDLNGFLQMTGQTEEQFKETQIKPEAERSLKIDVLFDEIAKAEAIEVKDEEINHSLDMIKAQYQMTDEQLAMFKEQRADEIKAEVLRSKITSFLYENNN